ncbi:MAG: acetoacetate decarboxylase family protein [Microcystaceae cyanobacterium]
MNNYPPAPWTLKGRAICTLQFVETKKAALFVPKELEIVSVFKKTAGAVYFSTYTAGSTLEYNELIISPATVRYQGTIGAWISHIYVDNPRSLAGGREIWGLNKEMADFNWQTEGKKQTISVSQNGQSLCSFRCQSGQFATWWPQKLSGSCFGLVERQFVYFTNQFESKINLVKGELVIPPESPFMPLGLRPPVLTLDLPSLVLLAVKPDTIGDRL